MGKSTDSEDREGSFVTGSFVPGVFDRDVCRTYFYGDEVPGMFGHITAGSPTQKGSTSTTVMARSVETKRKTTGVKLNASRDSGSPFGTRPASRRSMESLFGSFVCAPCEWMVMDGLSEERDGTVI